MNIAMLVLNNFLFDARVHKEAKTLAQAGYQVTVVAFYDGSAPEYVYQDGYHIHRIRINSRNWRVWIFTQIIRYFEFTLRAASTMIRLHPQVCHAHAIQALLPCWLAHIIARCKLVYDSHEFEQGMDFSSSTRIPKLLELTWTWPEKLLIHSTDSVITVSDSLADALARSYHIEQPVVIRNCPESKPYRAGSNYLHVKYNIPQDWPVVLYQGILTHGRGLIELVQSANELQNLAVVITGHGPLAETLMEAASKITSNTKFIFTGSIPMAHLPEMTASASIGVVLTQNTCLNHYYSLPNKLFEYVQAGLPVVGSNLPEIAKIIQEYQIGVVVDPDDPRNIASGIQQLIEKRGDSIARKNTVRVANIYNWENESRKLIILYRKLEVAP